MGDEFQLLVRRLRLIEAVTPNSQKWEIIDGIERAWITAPPRRPPCWYYEGNFIVTVSNGPIQKERLLRCIRERLIR